MAAKVAELCNDIVTTLNGLSFSQSFTAVRFNVWTDDLASATGLQVIVVPQDVETTSITRTDLQRKFRINVVVQKRLTTAMNTNTEQDALLLVAEEIENALYGKSMGAFAFVEYSDNAGTRSVIEVDAVSGSREFRTVMQIAYMGL